MLYAYGKVSKKHKKAIKAFLRRNASIHLLVRKLREAKASGRTLLDFWNEIEYGTPITIQANLDF
jgi:hypothetical protein